MTEGEFIRFYKSKNHEVVKEKIDLFRNKFLETMQEALYEDDLKI